MLLGLKRQFSTVCCFNFATFDCVLYCARVCRTVLVRSASVFLTVFKDIAVLYVLWLVAVDGLA